MSTKFHDAIYAYECRHRRTVERAYDLLLAYFAFYNGRHRRPDFT